ncbi:MULTISPECIES: hypothetical protein [Thermoactinomyces]|uniref:Uncharacterized protein n=1 Tax=Thermoactinomyces daqus TaxID=1329516 RepID=A0A7W1XAL9_9BACL|nr:MULTISPECIES: hypothetical protein [Thermoactinomyces]MBA4543152.1 hypothetical protein [Thermoactinomyces daqus]MBH8596612.1 hypothetical protein [Thermoactinomyces sp. CICC 10523]MBH8603374.1 hypothetical protein [Thermoactinomyces sp. CICC 10522]MBH8607859.1 hypothetical protein [Thermoactinomyces sp. CICC 10521]
MMKRYRRIGAEIFLTVAVVISLKQWFFPFLISLWFHDSLIADMVTEWTVLIVGAFTFFIYLGLGSSAKHVHHLPMRQSILGFVIFHLPLLLENAPLVQSFCRDWKNLLGDLLVLFFPWHFFSSLEIFMVYLLLFLFGRVIKITDLDEERAGMKEERLHQSTF